MRFILTLLFITATAHAEYSGFTWVRESQIVPCAAGLFVGSVDGLTTICTAGVAAEVDPLSLHLNANNFTVAAPIVYNSSTHQFSCAAASGSVTGCLSSTDWTTFNAKQAALSFGNVTTSTTGVSIGGTPTGAAVGAGFTINVQTASTSQPGLLSAADWATFNAKQATILTTKGDLPGFSTVLGRLPIDSDGKVLTADAASTFGFKWGTSSSGASTPANTDITSMSVLSTIDTTAGTMIHGKNTNTAASAGYNGERFLISRVRSNGLSVSSNVKQNIGTTTNVVLTAGHWQLSGTVCYQAGSVGAIADSMAAILCNESGGTVGTCSPSADTIGVPSASTGEIWIDMAGGASAAFTNGSVFCVNIPAYRVDVANAATNTLYLVGSASITGTWTMYGFLEADRVF